MNQETKGYYCDSTNNLNMFKMQNNQFYIFIIYTSNLFLQIYADPKQFEHMILWFK